jgi:hypothetical protein
MSYAVGRGAISESPPSEDGASWRMRILVGALTALALIGVSGMAEGAREGLAEVKAEPDLEFFNLLKALCPEIATEESLGKATLPAALSSVGFICALVTLIKEA